MWLRYTCILKFLSYPYTFLGSYSFLSSAWLTNTKLITMNDLANFVSWDNVGGADLINSYYRGFF